ncbi:hypothetical protein E2C01_090837 [Portunus trituberculatus]|uniref:Uncharacterized protein n=1 Tax=Portunus trituberculatus TaxID=210409 RepID=A0A5B7JLE9_PORTR|nr:hypothetical protein [Portunus trituberculatus]
MEASASRKVGRLHLPGAPRHNSGGAMEPPLTRPSLTRHSSHRHSVNKNTFSIPRHIGLQEIASWSFSALCCGNCSGLCLRCLVEKRICNSASFLVILSTRNEV